MTITAPRMTEAEFLRLPDDGRKYELVDGEVKEVPVGMLHDEICANVIALLRPYTRGRGALCGSQAGFRMKSSNLRCPDASFTQKHRLRGGRSPVGFGEFAPDLCIEVISLTEEPQEMKQKLREYFDSGAEQVWHLFPETESAIVYTSPNDSITLEAEDELDGGSLLPGFRCRVADLFDLG